MQILTQYIPMQILFTIQFNLIIFETGTLRFVRVVFLCEYEYIFFIIMIQQYKWWWVNYESG